ncbi:MAG: binary toxin-like calcium binding domain-containing protein, partial [Candidatus Heimdallarchaeota archaeon]
DNEEVVSGSDGYVTDPTAVDTDGDGLSDYAEVHTYSTDPTAIDSDLDGLNDGAEVLTYGTDPNKADTDGDGYTDFAEVLSGTDPTDPTDYPTTPPPETITLPPETTTVTVSTGITFTAVIGIAGLAFFALVLFFRKKPT